MVTFQKQNTPKHKEIKSRVQLDNEIISQHLKDPTEKNCTIDERGQLQTRNF